MSDKKLLLLGHRGSPKAHTENTMPGFQAAIDAGLDGIETDIRLLADGTLAIHHDPHLKDGRKLPELSRADLPEHVPVLADLLDWMAGNNAYVNVEIKTEGGRPDQRVSRTLDAIRARGLEKRVIISSFSPLTLAACRDYAPEIERAFLVHRTYKLGDTDLTARVMELTGSVALHPHYSLVDETLMEQAKALGWRVNVWTTNDEAEIARLKNLGVDALIGDYPARLLTAR